jgi:hypothetical protein
MVKHKNNFDLGKESELTSFQKKRNSSITLGENKYEDSNSASISTPGVSIVKVSRLLTKHM